MKIDEYFQILQQNISSSRLVVASEIEYDKRTDFIGIAKGRIKFVNDLELHFREFIDLKDREIRLKYKYHIQTKEGICLFRYDNVKHHPKVRSFPHHKHLGEERVTESRAPQLVEVIKEVIQFIADTTGKRKNKSR